MDRRTPYVVVTLALVRLCSVPCQQVGRFAVEMPIEVLSALVSWKTEVTEYATTVTGTYCPDPECRIRLTRWTAKGLEGAGVYPDDDETEYGPEDLARWDVEVEVGDFSVGPSETPTSLGVAQRIGLEELVQWL